jgi:hypothetical protein
MNSVSQAAGWPPDPSAETPPVAQDPSAQATQDDDSEPQGWYWTSTVADRSRSSIVIDVSETEQYRPRGRGRLVVLGRRTDNDERCTLLVVNEADGSWSFYGLGASAGVKLGKADTLALVELILARTESRDPR